MFFTYAGEIGQRAEDEHPEFLARSCGDSHCGYFLENVFEDFWHEQLLVVECTFLPKRLVLHK